MPARVLLVDDEQGFVETMAKRLEKREYEVAVAFNGQQGLDVLNERTIDVVVLDVKMPGMDGIETLKRIKTAHPLVEVVMLTGHATIESAIEGMKHGAFDYLMKPCEMGELLAKVTEANERKFEHEERILNARARHQPVSREE